jgi:hypothetical protein
MTFRHVGILGLAAGMMVGAPVLAKEASIDGTWNVRLMTEAGTCDSVYSQTVAIQNGQVRALSGDATISGGIARDGSVALTISNSLANANATGRINARRGSGGWNLAMLGCSGRWIATRA